MRSLSPQVPPKGFWRYDKWDVFIQLIAILSIGLIYFFLYTTEGTKGMLIPLRFQDSLAPLAQAKVLFKEKKSEFNHLDFLTDYTQCLPLYPFLLKCVMLITNGSTIVAQFLTIGLCSLLFAYSLRRLLGITRIATDPRVTAILCCVAPMRWTMMRVCCTSDTLHLSLICLSLIHFVSDNLFCSIIFATLASLTRVEGALMYLIIALLYTLRMRMSKVITVMTVAAVHYYFAMQTIKVPVFDTLLFPYHEQSKFSWIPMKHFMNIATSIQNLRVTHAYVELYGPVLVGSCALMAESVPLGVFCLVWTVSVSLFESYAIYRIMIPAQLLAIFGGFNNAFKTERARKLLLACSVLIFAVDCFYIRGEVRKGNYSKTVWETISSIA